MELNGILIFLLLVIIIIFVYPFLRINLSDVIKNTTLNVVISVTISIILLKNGIKYINLFFEKYDKTGKYSKEEKEERSQEN